MVNLHSDINIVIHRAYNPFNHCLLGAEPMKTFRSVEYWEVEWTIGTRMMVLLVRKSLLWGRGNRGDWHCRDWWLVHQLCCLNPQRHCCASRVPRNTISFFAGRLNIIRTISALSRRVMVISGGSPATKQRSRLSGRALVESTVLTAKVFGINENCIKEKSWLDNSLGLIPTLKATSTVKSTTPSPTRTLHRPQRSGFPYFKTNSI